MSGQTAWAILNDEPDPDENRLNSLTNISKWGWFMPYDISSGSDTDPVLAEFYAGAGRNNLNAGTDVGDVEISDDGDDLVVDIEMDPEFTLTESQLYVDTDTDRLRQIKAAPGAFDYKIRQTSTTPVRCSTPYLSMMSARTLVRVTNS
ncbi:hypothetical protein D8S78_06675 [Natrialba swarupiae]|nr:hypothetical protein [Natrialba swarupiae]